MSNADPDKLGVANLMFLLHKHYAGEHPEGWRCGCESCEWRRKQAVVQDINDSLAKQAREARGE